MAITPRKRIRLADERYAVPGSSWHVTIATRDKRPVFADPRYASLALSVLVEQCDFRGARLLLYCFMPDHIHAVIQVGSVDLVSVVRSIKAYVSRRCTEAGLTAGFWQERFHDRGVREHEDMSRWVAYITNNPVEAGLVEFWDDYPWMGGELLDGGSQSSSG